MYRFIWLPLLWLSGSVYAARGIWYHEVTGGINTFRSSFAPLSAGEARGELGFGGGMGYACHFSRQVSFRTGLEMNSYSGTSYVSTISEASTVGIPKEAWGWQGEVDWFELKATLTDYSVLQSTLYLQVPLLLGYENALTWTENMTWYANGGVKLSYSLFRSSRASAGSLTLFGDFEEEYGYPIYNAEVLGFGTAGYEQQSSPNFGFGCIGYLEVGLKQQLTQQYGLYAGVFGEYSLYSAVGGAATKMFSYIPETSSTSNRFYSIRYTPASHASTNPSRSFYPLSFGITLRFSLDVGGRKAKRRNDRIFELRYLDF